MQNSEGEIPQPDDMNGHSVSATSTRSGNPDIEGNILKSMSKNSTQGTPTEPRTEDRPIQSTKDKSKAADEHCKSKKQPSDLEASPKPKASNGSSHRSSSDKDSAKHKSKGKSSSSNSKRRHPSSDKSSTTNDNNGSLNNDLAEVKS